MFVERRARTLAALWLLAVVNAALAQDAAKYKIPDITIQALKPKGFRAWIPDAPKLALFAFQGNINRSIGNKDVGTLSGEVLSATDGRWVFADPGAELKVGDIVNYYVFVSVNGVGYLKDNLSFTVQELEDPTTSAGPAECQPTQTVVWGGRACAGQTIFEDNFDSLREDVWQIDHMIPVSHPEYPFVSYQRGAGTAATAGGELRLTPRLQQTLPGFSNESIYSGQLNLFNGCTGPSAEACAAQASGAGILPPVASARLRSKTFAFTYGTVRLRAKLPQGDWLYPEILLKPLMQRYGSLEFASGVLKIATARGNMDLFVGENDYSNKVLYGGPIIDGQCRQALLGSKRAHRPWGDDYHVYALRWAPDLITLSVDDVEWALVEPAAGGLRARLPAHCRRTAAPLATEATTPMTPFDQPFYLSLGLAAGGISEFPDGAVTLGGRPKPWRNSARKASLHFWQDTSAWLPTWTHPELLVDYIKVTAL